MICDSEVVDIGQFRIFRRDRSSSTSLKWDGRGAFVAVRRDLRPSLVPEFQSNAEDVWIQISVGGQRVFMCCVYIIFYIHIFFLETPPPFQVFHPKCVLSGTKLYTILG